MAHATRNKVVKENKEHRRKEVVFPVHMSPPAEWPAVIRDGVLFFLPLSFQKREKTRESCASLHFCSGVELSKRSCSWVPSYRLTIYPQFLP